MKLAESTLKQIVKSELIKFLNEAETVQATAPAQGQNKNEPRSFLEAKKLGAAAVYKYLSSKPQFINQTSNAINKAKQQLLSAFNEVDVNQDVTDFINSFDVMPPTPKKEESYWNILHSNKDQHANEVIYNLLVEIHNMFSRGITYINNERIEVAENDNLGYIMSIMIRRFKLDPAVKQAVAKIKQKLGDEMPTPKVSQAQMAQQTQKAPPRQGVAQPK